MFPGRLVREGRANVVVAARYLRQRRRNGSGVVSGDIRREVVRDEPRANRDVLPGRDEEVPKGERAHFDNVIQRRTTPARRARLAVAQGPSAILRAAEISLFFPPPSSRFGVFRRDEREGTQATGIGYLEAGLF